MGNPISPLYLPITPLPPTEETTTSGENHLVHLIGDEQYFDDPELLGFYRSLAVLGVGPPGIRLPGMTYGVPFSHETLVRQHLSPEMKELYQGIISTGDVADVASTREIDEFVITLDRLKKADPIIRTLMFMIGNHDALHSGTAHSGTNFFGLLGVALNLQQGRNYREDIHGAEVGGVNNILDKEKLIHFIYDYFLDLPADPVVIDYSYAPSQYSRNQDNNQAFGNPFPPATYRLASGKEKSWDNTEEVFKTFWKQAPDGSWNALVTFKPDREGIRPEKKWLYTSAIKMEDLQTANGNHPIYFINLDTLDFLKDTTLFGSVIGHVSSIQVQIIKAFISQMKKIHAGENPKFIVGGHFPVTSIQEVRESGLNKILSDPDVILSLAGHTHQRGFEDLNSRELAFKYNIDRSSPLPMIVAPAVMDWPNEMVSLRYGVEDPQNNELFFEFTFQGIDRNKIPGLTPEVMAELRDIYPHLNSFKKAMEHFDDQQLAEFADPRTSIYRKIYLALSVDEGLFTKQGAIHDLVVAQDVIPTMVQNNILYKEFFIDTVKLLLIEAGYQEHADQVESIYTEYLDYLESYYEEIYRENNKTEDEEGFFQRRVQKDREGDRQRHIDVHHIQELQEKLNSQMEILGIQVAEAGNEDPEKTSLLDLAAHILPLMKDDLDSFKEWLIHYELVQRTKRSDAELLVMPHLYGNYYFKAIRSHLREIPSGSQASAYATLVALESAEIYKKFRKPVTDKGPKEKEVPDQIRVTISTINNQVQYTTADLPEPEWTLEDKGGEDKTNNIFPEQVEETRPLISPITHGHWYLKTGLGRGSGITTDRSDPESPLVTEGPQNHLHLELGRQWHLLDQPKAPRINLYVGGGLNLEWQNREVSVDGGSIDQWTNNLEFPARAGLTIGDPLGIVDLGPFVKGGLALQGYDTTPLNGEGGTPLPSFLWGYGLNVQLLEGALWLEYGQDFQNNSLIDSSEKYGMGGVDLLAWMRLVGLRNRTK